MTDLDIAGLDADELAAVAGAHLSTVADALNELDRLCDVQVDRDSLAALLVGLRDARSSLSRVFANAEQALLSEAGRKTFEVPGLGRFEVRRNTKRTDWKLDDLVPVLVVKAQQERHYDGDSGQVEGEGEAVARVLRACVGFSYGKVRELATRGIQADEYATVDENNWTVSLPAKAEP